MIDKSTVQTAFGIEIPLNSTMTDALELWSQMYENRATWVTGDIESLNLASAIASEIARVSTIEAEVTIEGSPRADFLLEQLQPILSRLREIIEFGVAKGSLILKPYPQGKKLAVDIVQADQFYPVGFNSNGDIVSCVFVDRKEEGRDYFTRLEYHKWTDGKYEVHNKAFRGTSREELGREIPLSEVSDWRDLTPSATIENVEHPLFGYFRNPGANNIDPASPLGVSCFSRATSLIESADVQWSNLLWEFESGQRALYVDSLAFTRDRTTGKPVLPNKRLYRTLETGTVEGDLYEEWSPDLRESNILAGLDAMLKKIEFTCGLAYGVLSDPNIVDRTATEIKSSKQRTYSTVIDTQKAIQRALDGLLYAMDIWASLGKLAPKGSYEVTYDFDDSVIIDRDAQLQQDMQLVGAMLMGKVEFRMRNFGESEAEAKKKIQEVMDEQPDDMFETERG